MEKRFRSIAITGATGTLGVSLIKQCIEKNIKVLAFVNPGSLNEKRIPKHENVYKVHCGLEELENFDVAKLFSETDLFFDPEEGINKLDVFVHLAWGHTNRAVRNNMKPQIDNIRYSIDSVELAKKLGCHTYIGAGSQAEYGRYEVAINEEMTPHPESAYGMAKLCSGQMTRSLCRDYDIRHIWPRIFSTYGPYTQETTIVSTTISKLLNNEKPSLTACEQIWDFLYVDDAVRALLLLADMGKDGEIYNISSGETKTLREYMEIVRSIVNPEGEIGFGDVEYGPGTVMHLEGNIAKLKKTTGFVPEISFVDGIQRTMNFMLRQNK